MYPVQQLLLSCCLVMLTHHSLCTLGHPQVAGSTSQCANVLWDDLGLHNALLYCHPPQVCSCCFCFSSRQTCEETTPYVCHLQDL